MGQNDHDGRDEGGEGGGGDEELINPRAPFTRRTFLAGAGAAAAATMVGTRKAHAGNVSPGSVFKIHPAIGVARLGNADPSTFFIGPEAPGFAPAAEVGTQVPNYKDPTGKIKPQAARFRIFEYEEVNGVLHELGEVFPDPGNNNVASIAWTVHLANKKASFYGFEGGQGETDRAPAPPRNAWAGSDPAARHAALDIDFGPRSITGSSQAGVEFKLGTGGGYPETAPVDPKGGVNNSGRVIDYLGQLRTDPQGRLIVIGGKGVAGYDTTTQPAMPHWANNDHWFDDASDGPVTAVVTLVGGATIEIDANSGGGAWVLCGPPDFAPGIPGSVTAYDLLLDMTVRDPALFALSQADAIFQPGGEAGDMVGLRALATGGNLGGWKPDYHRHIEPMLVAAYNLWWVDSLVNAKHNTLLASALGDNGSGAKAKRQRVFNYMRPPLTATAGGVSMSMPKLLGDDPYIGQMPEAVKHLPLTHLQYEMLRMWAAGTFTPADPSRVPPPFDISPHGLDRAALENCVGGAFFPGIEFGWQMRNPRLFLEPFRIDLNAASGYWTEGQGASPVMVGPGHFSRQMAVPWQADFNDCRNEGNYGWWPSQRPTQALPSTSATKRVEWARATNRFVGGNAESTHEDMVNHWHRFGFVLEAVLSDGRDGFIEKERAAEIR